MAWVRIEDSGYDISFGVSGGGDFGAPEPTLVDSVATTFAGGFGWHLKLGDPDARHLLRFTVQSFVSIDQSMAFRGADDENSPQVVSNSTANPASEWTPSVFELWEYYDDGDSEAHGLDFYGDYPEVSADSEVLLEVWIDGECFWQDLVLADQVCL